MLKLAQAKAMNLNLRAMTTPRKQLVEQINLLVSSTLGYSMVYSDIVNTNYNEVQVLSQHSKDTIEKSGTADE